MATSELETLSFPGDNPVHIQRSSYSYLDKQSGKWISIDATTYLIDVSHWYHSPFNSNLSWVTRVLIVSYSTSM